MSVNIFFTATGGYTDMPLLVLEHSVGVVGANMCHTAICFTKNLLGTLE